MKMAIVKSYGPVLSGKNSTICFFSLLSRCFAALGNVSKARFLNKTNKMADLISVEYVHTQTTNYSSEFIIHNVSIYKGNNIAIVVVVLLIIIINTVVFN